MIAARQLPPSASLPIACILPQLWALDDQAAPPPLFHPADLIQASQDARAQASRDASAQASRDARAEVGRDARAQVGPDVGPEGSRGAGPWVSRDANAQVGRDFSLGIPQPQFTGALAPGANSVELCGAAEHIAPTPPELPDRKRIAAYRGYTQGLLRRYLRMSMSIGRMPSLIGRELFRAKVSSYRTHTFEEVVIFCHDMDKCLAQLNPGQSEILTRIAIEEYTICEVAAITGIDEQTVTRRYARALDRLSQILLDAGMLKSCQERKTGQNPPPRKSRLPRHHLPPAASQPPSESASQQGDRVFNLRSRAA